MCVRSLLKPGVDLSAHIDQIFNAVLGFEGNNAISIKYTYNTSESAAHHSSIPLIRL
jgi:hypothetical protein